MNVSRRSFIISAKVLATKCCSIVHWTCFQKVLIDCSYICATNWVQSNDRKVRIDSSKLVKTQSKLHVPCEVTEIFCSTWIVDIKNAAFHVKTKTLHSTWIPKFGMSNVQSMTKQTLNVNEISERRSISYYICIGENAQIESPNTHHYDR